MNAVRSAGGGGGSNNGNSYKLENENASVTNPIIRPSCSISELMRKTNFSKNQIQHLYRTFKQDCPSGEVNKSHFSTIFATLFPSGEGFRYSQIVFQNIDRANTGHIRFEDLIATLSILINGSIEERLGWVFDLYDLNKDGTLTKAELLQLVAAIFQLMVPISKLNFTAMTNVIEERTNYLFETWDIHGNGLVQKRDFLRYCLQNEAIRCSVELFKPNI